MAPDFVVTSLKLSLESFLLMAPNCSSGRKQPGQPPHPWCYLSFFFFFFFNQISHQQLGLHHVCKSATAVRWLHRVFFFLINALVVFCIQRRIGIKSSRDPSVMGDLELSEWRHGKSALKAIPGMFVHIRRHGYKRQSQLSGSCRATLWTNCLTLIQKSNTAPAGPLCPLLE